MKSLSFCGPLGPDENSLLMFSLRSSFRRLAFSCSSAKIFAVRDAVDAFLMPLVEALLPLMALGDFEFSFVAMSATLLDPMPSPSAACFFRFLPDPEAFFSECVRPCSLNDSARFASLFLSNGAMGRILMMFSAV